MADDRNVPGLPAFLQKPRQRQLPNDESWADATVTNIEKYSLEIC